MHSLTRSRRLSIEAGAKVLTLLGMLFWAQIAYGQGAFLPTKTVFGTVNGISRGIGGAVITVCAAGASGIPCSPALSGATFKDQALTQPLANPTVSDANGNYPAIAMAAGTYTVTESAAGFTGFSYQVTVSCLGGANNCTITGSLNSNNLAAGNVANKNFTADAIRYVSASGNDANDGLSWGTAKATLSAGLSALPNCTITPTPVSATGGVGSSVTNSCGFVYLTEGLFTIPSAVTINSSFVGIKGMGQFNTILSCSTGSAACITINGAASWGGTVTAYPGGLFDLDIEGGGAAGTGLVYLNGTGLHLHRVRIAGFTATGGQGLMVQDDNSVTPPNAGCAYSERMDWQDVALDNNKTLLRLDTVTGACTSMGHQNWSGLKLQLNNGQTAIKLTGATSFYSSSVSGVINTYPPNTNTYTSLDLSGLTGAGAFSQMSFLMIHDNGGGGTLTACNGCTQANFHNIVGWSPSSNVDNQVQDGGWLLNGSATGLNGAVLSFAINNALKMQEYVDGANGLSFWNGSANAVSIDPTQVVVGASLPLLVTGGPARATQAIADQGAVCTNGELALSAGWQSTGTATVTAVAGNGQTCNWTITTGTTTAANPTVTDTLTNALPAATTVCEMNIHGGTHTAAAGEGFQQTTLSATAPIFTFNGTPTAGGTTYFVTRRCGP